MVKEKKSTSEKTIIRKATEKQNVPTESRVPPLESHSPASIRGGRNRVKFKAARGKRAAGCTIPGEDNPFPLGVSQDQRGKKREKTKHQILRKREGKMWRGRAAKRVCKAACENDEEFAISCAKARSIFEDE